ncbi:arginine--tRNA ligase [Capsulimonas corticalis]|uniref:Arginine--tRNA ligase n=1 Tax=Capsulimonas corticalis TaxID=2219043 RepID=A0A402CWR7_9BACT|nr:arginine--tRNA ligase [Capsulimonas corticalis]BDI34209.1 arginine--tRNA ligase [Capsulimonas corticalis]
MIATLSLLRTRFQEAVARAHGVEGADVLVLPASNPQFGDLQVNVALQLAKAVGKSPRAIAEGIVAELKLDEMCETPTIAGPGFINLKLKASYLDALVNASYADPRLGVAPAANPLRTVVDFSGPNIAKEMHVGHLRSTIIGDSIARISEFLGHDVLRLNHVGDWGTQFGMLIAFLRDTHPEALTDASTLDIGDLVGFYKRAKLRFDADEEFKERARREVVRLQGGDAESLYAWKLLCDQSRAAFEKIYQTLDIKITERGESFYNPLLPAVVTDLEAQGLLTESDGALCVFVEGFSNKEGNPLPLIIRKTDGAYNYATTDLAALRYRINEDKAKCIVIVTDIGQSDHFAQVFAVARLAGWLTEDVRVVHVPFGLVQGEDGKKFKTRSGETVKLSDLLDEAVVRARAHLDERLASEGREETEEFKTDLADKVGIAAVKYADLSANRGSNYVFSFDKMLALQGNTAPYMLYAYVRVQGIARKGGVDFASLAGLDNIHIAEPSERDLAKHLLELDDVLVKIAEDFLPSRLCTYLFELSQKFNHFYEACPVLNAAEPTRTSRLALADLTARTLKLGLSLLGISTVERL